MCVCVYVLLPLVFQLKWRGGKVCIACIACLFCLAYVLGNKYKKVKINEKVDSVLNCYPAVLPREL